MGAPNVNRLQKAMQGITIGVVKDTQARRDKILRDGLQERVEEIRLPIAGSAEEFPAWSETTVRFQTNFVNATGQRDSPFTTPHFSYGAYLTTSTPVGIFAVVMEYTTNGREETIGARIAVGVAATDQPTRFRGEVHCTFTGYGQPFLAGIEDDA